MRLEKKVLAFDAGGGSTRISKIGFDGSRFTLEQIARFPNGPVRAGGNLYWDILGIWRDLLDGLRQALCGDSEIESLGIDTWGNDFVLLDRKGCMLKTRILTVTAVPQALSGKSAGLSADGTFTAGTVYN